MVIDIKDKQGQIRVSVPVQTGAKGVFTLMSADYIQLPFSSEKVIPFKLGDYADLSEIEYEGLGGKIAKVYEIVDMNNVNPTYNEETGAYDYTLRLDAYYWKWKNKIFKYTPENAGQESSWSLTAALEVHLGVLIRNLNALGYRYKGMDFTFSIDNTVENKAVAVTYDNTNILDALFMLASKQYYNCDCWITDNVIHFGRNEFGDAVKIERGVEAETIGKAESKGTYATRIYAFGGTRNIPINYRPTEEQAVVNGVVQKRLMLPVDTPYIDAYPNMTTEEAIEDVVVFDDIYPRRIGTMSNITTVDRDIVDGSSVVGTFKAYQYKDTGLVFSEDYIIEGQELKIRFQSGKMNGMEFSVQFNPNGKNPAEQLWEIIRNEDYGRPLPDDTIRPENGDEYILSGFNIQLVSDLYIPEAEQELKERALKYAEMAKKDDGTYPVTLRSDFVFSDPLKHNYEFGQKVNLVDKAYFENGRISRILGWEIKLDIPFDSPKYTIGESAAYSRFGDLEDKIDALTFKGQTYTGVGGSGVYVIKTNDSTAPSDANVFSAKRSISMFLRKDIEDYVPKMKTSSIESKSFSSGALGSGMQLKQNADGKTYFEIDKMYVRLKAYFDSLEIREITHVGGQQLLTAASMKCNRVEVVESRPIYFFDGTRKVFSDGKLAYTPKRYRCFFNADDGEEAVVNQFVVGDLAMCRQFNIKPGVYENVSNRYYWYEVVGVGDNYIEFSERLCDEGSDIPQPGDKIIQLGNRNDPFRQNAILLSSVGDNAPCKILYQGINDFTLDGKAIIEEGFDSYSNQAYTKIYGKAYIGAKDESSYISFDPTTNKMKIKAEVEITSGSGFGNLTDKPDIDGMNEGIQNAQNSANAAQNMANEAKADAAEANNDLNNFKSDNIISPVEKTALKQQLADINSEYSQIISNANKYSISTTSYTSAYNSAKTALTKYTASSPEFISIGSDYNNISAYYTARQTILDTIATKAKEYADSIGDSAKEDVAQRMGYRSYADMVAKAEAGSTIIKGGKINTELIETENLKISGSIFTPLFRITSSNYKNYVVSKGSYNEVNIGSTGFNVQFEYYDESASPLPLYPIVTKDLLGCNVKIFNYTKNSIPVRYGIRNSYNTGTILTMAYNNLLSGGYIEMILIQKGEYSSSLPDKNQFTYILTSSIGLESDI